MIQSTDPSYLRGWAPDGAINYDPDELLRDGFCLISGEDVALFERKGFGVVTGHYFFRSRGREAIRTGEEMLRYLFNSCNVSVVQGLTPTDNKGALWMTRRLGFKMMDVLDTDLGKMQLSMLTKKDYE